MNILITGGASGLGAAITRRLAAEEGNFVHFTWHRSAEKAAAMERQFPNTKGWQCDFSDPASVGNFIENIPELALGALVNNAMPLFPTKHFHKIGLEEFEAGFRQNLLPVLRISQAALRFFQKNRAGKVVTILSSALAGKPPVGWSAYVAEKSYLLAMSKCWATEYGRYGVTSNCISPSFMRTDLHADMDERMIEEVIKNSPQQRLLEPEEVAETVHFLLHHAHQMNGENLLINQGADF